FSDVVDEFDFSDVVEEQEFDFSDVAEPSTAETIGAAVSAFPVAKGLYDFGRTIYSGLADTAPQSLAQTAEVAKTLLNPSNAIEYVRTRPVDFQRYVRDRDPKYSGIGGFFTPFDMEEALPKYAQQFVQD